MRLSFQKIKVLHEALGQYRVIIDAKSAAAVQLEATVGELQAAVAQREVALRAVEARLAKVSSGERGP